jgi:hypothetical protein
VSSNLDNVRVQELEPRSELRVELIEASLRAVVAPTSAAESDGGGSVAAGVCYFKLISGTAELFGTELAQVRPSVSSPAALAAALTLLLQRAKTTS